MSKKIPQKDNRKHIAELKFDVAEYPVQNWLAQSARADRKNVFAHIAENKGALALGDRHYKFKISSFAAGSEAEAEGKVDEEKNIEAAPEFKKRHEEIIGFMAHSALVVFEATKKEILAEKPEFKISGVELKNIGLEWNPLIYEYKFKYIDPITQNYNSSNDMVTLLMSRGEKESEKWQEDFAKAHTEALKYYQLVRENAAEITAREKKYNFRLRKTSTLRVAIE